LCFQKCQLIDSEFALGWFGQGVASSMLGREDAIKLYEHAYNLGKTAHFEILYNFSRQYFSKRDIDPEMFTLGNFALFKVAELQYRDPVAYNLLGLYLELQGQNERALSYFHKALELIDVEKSMPVRENLARCLCSAKDFRLSVEEYQNVLDHGNAFTWAGYGLALFLNESYQESLVAFDSALKKTKELESLTFHNQVTVLVAQVLNMLGEDDHLELAKQQLLECFMNDSAFVQSIICLAAMGIVHEDWTLSQSAVTELLKLEPHLTVIVDEEIFLLLSRMFLLQGDSHVASKFLAKSVHRYPWQAKRWSSYSEFIAIHNHQIQNAQVLGTCADVLANHVLTPHLTTDLNERSETVRTAGLIHLLSANEKMAKSKLSRALFLKPFDSRNWLALGIDRLAYQDLSGMETCLSAFQFLTTNDDDSSWGVLLLCNSQLAQQKQGFNIDFSALLQQLDSIATQCNGFIQEVAYVTLGRILFVMNELDDSVQSLKNAVSLAVSSTHHWVAPFFYLAKVYQNSNRFDAAWDCYDAALKTSHNKTPLVFQAQHLFRTNEYERALELINTAATHSSDSPTILFLQTICFREIDPKKYSYRISKNMEFLENSLDREFLQILK
jgi:tetratricopeptide (TPR) repeat protein